jgi:hypothetical protein
MDNWQLECYNDLKEIEALICGKRGKCYVCNEDLRNVDTTIELNGKVCCADCYKELHPDSLASTVDPQPPTPIGSHCGGSKQ